MFFIRHSKLTLPKLGMTPQNLRWPPKNQFEGSRWLPTYFALFRALTSVPSSVIGRLLLISRYELVIIRYFQLQCIRYWGQCHWLLSNWMVINLDLRTVLKSLGKIRKKIKQLISKNQIIVPHFSFLFFWNRYKFIYRVPGFHTHVYYVRWVLWLIVRVNPVSWYSGPG